MRGKPSWSNSWMSWSPSMRPRYKPRLLTLVVGAGGAACRRRRSSRPPSGAAGWARTCHRPGAGLARSHTRTTVRTPRPAERPPRAVHERAPGAHAAGFGRSPSGPIAIRTAPAQRSRVRAGRTAAGQCHGEPHRGSGGSRRIGQESDKK